MNQSEGFLLDWRSNIVLSSGYYRVNYDRRNWELLVDQLKRRPEEIHVINRAQIISDAFVLNAYNLVDWNIIEGLSSYLRDEMDFLPWLSASKHISTLAYYLPDYQEHRVSYVIIYQHNFRHPTNKRSSSKISSKISTKTISDYIRCFLLMNSYDTIYGHSKKKFWSKFKKINQPDQINQQE